MKTLVELTFTELEDHVSACHFRGFGEDRDVVTENLRNVRVTESVLVSKRDTQEEVHYLKKGFKFYEEDWHTGKLVFRKEEHFCFTNETKEVLDKLYLHEIDKWKKKIKDAYNLQDEAYSLLKKSNHKVITMEDTVEGATFLKRLKYLFTGKLL